MFYNFWCLQTILESLPISSSGHLKLVNCILQYFNYPSYTDGVKEYIDHLMHIPTALILGIFLFQQWGHLLFKLPQSLNQITHLFICIFLADIITVTLYFIFHIINVSQFPVAVGFFITAVMLLSLHFAPNAVSENITYKQALIIGLVQGIALLPGISRLGATYVIAYWLGINPISAITFSLAIQLPLILAGIAKGLFLIFVKGYYFPAISFGNIATLSGAAVISYGCLLWVVKLAENHVISRFGIYMLLPTILALFCK